MIKVYLAGPEVFLHDAVEVGRKKKALCAERGFEGLYPFDNEIPAFDSNFSKFIFDANIKMISDAAAIICNLTPFRGPSADVGTVFELGFANGMTKPCFGYSNVGTPFVDRVKEVCGFIPSSKMTVNDGMSIEDFGNTDNLMIDESVRATRPIVVTNSKRFDKAYRYSDEPFRDLTTFTECLDMVAAYFQSGTMTEL